MSSATDRLLAIMERLRDPEGGCPWDREQTFSTIARHTIEEAYEVVEAIEQNDRAALRDELGDLLFQVVFYAQMSKEDGGFTFEDVAEGICRKMERRHPHVFGADSDYAHLAPVGTSDDETLTRNWAAIKAAEKSRTSALDGIPATLPALSWAQKSWRRAAEAGTSDLPGPADSPPRDADDLAEQLLALVVTAESNGWDAEAALRGRVRALHSHVRSVEASRDDAEDDGGQRVQ